MACVPLKLTDLVYMRSAAFTLLKVFKRLFKTQEMYALQGVW